MLLFQFELVIITNWNKLLIKGIYVRGFDQIESVMVKQTNSIFHLNLKLCIDCYDYFKQMSYKNGYSAGTEPWNLVNLRKLT